MRLKGELIYTILKPIAKKIFYRRFNIQEGEYVLPDKGQPFILVGHHVSAFDPIIVNAFSKRIIRFLYADANNDLPVRAFALRMLDMIPFSKNSADFKSIRKIKERLANGQAIGIFPEGGATWDGKTDPLIYSTSKLIKMMNVDVYGIRFNGAYLSKPRWCDETRCGQVVMDTYKIFDGSELKTLKADVIHQKLTEALAYNEFEWEREVKIPFKGKNLAESIEKLLYYCPECHSFNSITSSGDEFTCKHCHEVFKYDEYGQIHHKQSDKLYQYQIPKWNTLQREKLQGVLKKENTGVNEVVENNESDLMDRSDKGLSLLNKPLKAKNVELRKDGEKVADSFVFDGVSIDAGDKLMFSEFKSISITFNRVIDFHYENEAYTIELLDGTNLSAKLLYDCMTFIKED